MKNGKNKNVIIGVVAVAIIGMGAGIYFVNKNNKIQAEKNKRDMDNLLNGKGGASNSNSMLDLNGLTDMFKGLGDLFGKKKKKDDGISDEDIAKLNNSIGMRV